jgi:Universal stress protein UspA and related nucleotide-binding proteins
MFKKILWVTDFSEPARHAGQRALQCAQCSDGVLYALTVVDPGDLPLVLDDAPDPFVDQDRLQAQYEQRVLDHLKREVESLGEVNVPVEFHLRVGVPWREIVRAAEELGATLIVIGSRGRRGLADVLLGSTVENVTRHAPCPVLVAR